MNEIQEHNEQLYVKWWNENGNYLLSHGGPMELAKAAFLAGRRTMLPRPTEEWDEDADLILGTDRSPVGLSDGTEIPDRDYHDGI